MPFLSRTPHESFSPDDILPEDGQYPYPKRPQSDLDPKTAQQDGGAELVFGAPPQASPATRDGSVSPPSVFDAAQGNNGQETEPTTVAGSSDDPVSYDLKPPPPSVSHENIEALSERIFSVDHLDHILRDSALSSRFAQFLRDYRPQQNEALRRYLEAKKALAAIEYANALAEQMPVEEGQQNLLAAAIDEDFEARSQETVADLVEEALPAYITYRLTTLVTDTLVKEITGNNAPIMRELVPSLAEVYCISDPSLPDNPLVYASEAFFNITQYGRDYVIGRNCRFLQGPKTSNASVRRLIEALAAGQEVCETILNYRRDGTPFMNLLLLAPLYDNKGSVRYFLGAQIDVSSLVQGGRGMESFAQLIAKDRADSRFGGRYDRDPKKFLGELGQMLTEDEAASMTSRAKTMSDQDSVGRSTNLRMKGGRMLVGMDDGPAEKELWPSANLGPSGRLPGVYQNVSNSSVSRMVSQLTYPSQYLLVRPYPSLRITFTSPALRIPGLLQTKFLDRIGGPAHVREGILDALSHSTPVTAKVSWITNAVGADEAKSQQSAGPVSGKPRWIHCTPLLGSDEKVGVWMIVMVEKEEVTGSLNRGGPASERAGSSHGIGVSSPKFDGNKLYADYLKREGKDGQRPTTTESQGTTASARERREVDANFRDF